MLEFFQTCCFLSVFWIVLTTFLGEVLDGIGDMDMDGLSLGINFSSRSFLFGIVIFSVCGWTILENGQSLSTPVVFIISITAGLLSAFLFEHFVIRLLKRLQSTSSVSESSFIGCEAELTEPTSLRQFGKARLIVNGNTLDFATKGQSEEMIPKGTIVTILSIEKGILIVGPKENER